MPAELDAVIVGAGPNGLAAAIALAQAGLSVRVLEANSTIGGGARSAELTLPGFAHDTGSAVYPLAVGSPFLRTLPLERFGLEWIEPEIQLAHPLNGGRAACLRRSIEETANSLGNDGRAYERLMKPLVRNWTMLADEFLQPMLHVPRHPFALARFGLLAVRSARGLARGTFRTEEARALFAGIAGHSFLPLEARGSAAIGLVLGMAGHAVGWPIPRGGAQAVTNALAAYLKELGGTIETEWRVNDLTDLPQSRVALLDVTPWQLLRMTTGRLPTGYSKQLKRFQHAPGVCKIDYALSEAIPWASAECRRAGTLHLGGTLDEIAVSERAVARGEHPEKPFILLAQQSVFDSSRAPAGQHTLWAYCHVPNGSTVDMSQRIEQQIERFAPGFRDCILARHVMKPADLQASNPNLIGGDINGGAATLRQLLARPILSPTPYRTPIPGIYLCSSSTPPGGGVHGMCGWHAAQAALRDVFGK
ncbi:MAG TPA: NAD(P)/FAD-dependent oxidoreductase [Chthoniobacteraceae bacterium]|jgi:phytoene dehydrogenase-like protein